MAAIIAVYLTLPGLRGAMIFLAGLSGAAALLLGLARKRLVEPVALLLMAGAALCYAASGAIVWSGMRGLPSRQPSLTAFDTLALARYLLLGAALWLFARRRSPRDRRNIIDAVTVTLGLAMLLWLFRILPNLLVPGLSGEQRAVSIAYPLVQVAVMLALARLLVPGLVWTWSVWLVITGAACALAGSVVFGLLRVNLTRLDWPVVDVGWMVCFALIRGAALHPVAEGLSYLREMPIDVVKIDRSFVDGIDRSPQRLALVEGIIAIAHTLRMSVIAEGVETEAQYRLLTQVGCEYGQGYLMAKPLDLTKADALLRTGQPLIPSARTSSPLPD
jgi:hypothetical protein